MKRTVATSLVIIDCIGLVLYAGFVAKLLLTRQTYVCNGETSYSDTFPLFALLIGAAAIACVAGTILIYKKKPRHIVWAIIILAFFTILTYLAGYFALVGQAISGLCFTF